ncbi:MAG: hypothetical protein WCG99_04815 [Candidatus Berkelbacteria bacterium]
MIEEIQKELESYNGSWKDKNSFWEFSSVIAERKAFLSSKKLTYSARVKIVDDEKVVHFSEMLIEVGSGLSSGGFDSDGGMSTGFGFKTESYNTMNGGREGNIEEQSNLFGKKFEYKFDYKEIRNKIEEVVKSTGYKLEYQVLPVK